MTAEGEQQEAVCGMCGERILQDPAASAVWLHTSGRPKDRHYAYPRRPTPAPVVPSDDEARFRCAGCGVRLRDADLISTSGKGGRRDAHLITRSVPDYCGPVNEVAAAPPTPSVLSDERCSTCDRREREDCPQCEFDIHREAPGIGACQKHHPFSYPPTPSVPSDERCEVCGETERYPGTDLLRHQHVRPFGEGTDDHDFAPPTPSQDAEGDGRTQKHYPLRAAKDLGKRAIGIELREDYCEIAVKRLAQGVLL